MHGYQYTYTRALRVYIKNATHLQVIFKYFRHILLSTIIPTISARIQIVNMARRIKAKSLSSRTRVCPLKDTGNNFTQQCVRSSGP